MTGVTPAFRGLLPVLITGILGSTLLPLGLVFTILALADADDIPLALGLAFLAAGVLVSGFALISFLSSRARARREAAARVSHGSAQVVEARHNWHVRIGARHPLQLTVEFAGGRHTRTLHALPHVDFTPGERISVAYAPDDPANFVPVSAKWIDQPV